MEVDHYAVLGLPSGIAGAKLSQKEITKAYKLKALELHPDKRRDDPNAHKKFQKLQNSYDILKDRSTRQVYDDLVRREPEVVLRDLMREKMMDDLRKKEMAAREEEERRRRRMDDLRKKEMAAWEEEERRRRRMDMMVVIAFPVICVFCLLAMIPVRIEVVPSMLGIKDKLTTEVPPTVRNVIGKKCAFEVKLTSFNEDGREGYTVARLSELTGPTPPTEKVGNTDAPGTSKKQKVV